MKELAITYGVHYKNTLRQTKGSRSILNKSLRDFRFAYGLDRQAEEFFLVESSGNTCLVSATKPSEDLIEWGDADYCKWLFWLNVRDDFPWWYAERRVKSVVFGDATIKVGVDDFGHDFLAFDSRSGLSLLARKRLPDARVWHDVYHVNPVIESAAALVSSI